MFKNLKIKIFCILGIIAIIFVAVKTLKPKLTTEIPETFVNNTKDNVNNIISNN